MNNNSKSDSYLPSSIFKKWFNIGNYLDNNTFDNNHNLIETTPFQMIESTPLHVIESKPFQVLDCHDNVIDISQHVLTNTNVVSYPNSNLNNPTLSYTDNTIIYQNTCKPTIDKTDLFTSSYIQNDEVETSSFINELIKDLNYKYDKLNSQYVELKDQQNKNAEIIDKLIARVDKMNLMLEKQSELFIQNMLHHTFSNNALPSIQLLQYKMRNHHTPSTPSMITCQNQ